MADSEADFYLIPATGRIDTRCTSCRRQINREHGRQYRKDNPEKVKQQQQASAARWSMARSARMRERYRANRVIVDKIKMDAGCKDCGYAKHPSALDFDHLPGHPKSFSISKSLRRTEAAILEEIAHCEVVCANCHRIRTYTRKNPA